MSKRNRFPDGHPDFPQNGDYPPIEDYPPFEDDLPPIDEGYPPSIDEHTPSDETYSMEAEVNEIINLIYTAAHSDYPV